MEQEHSPVMRVFIEDDIRKAIVRQPASYKMKCYHVLDQKNSLILISASILYPLCTVNSRLADTPLLRTLALTDKIQIPDEIGLTGNDSRYYGLSL